MLLSLTACDTWPKSHLEIPPVSPKAYQAYKMDIEQKKNVIEQKCVFIDGQDIQLPLTSGNFDPQENRTYSFYVWAYDTAAPAKKTLEELWREGIFNLDIVGVKASISTPDYLPASGTQRFFPSVNTNGLSAEVIGSMLSRSILEIRIRSQDITGPFTIVAWFPEKYRNWSGQGNKTGPNSNTDSNAKNPYGEKRQVKVYNGDLRTRIDIVDEREAEASFGKQFAKHFCVGRVYLRNRHTDKRMVVYTTSLRAKILFYRPPVPKKPEPNPQVYRNGYQPNIDAYATYQQDPLDSDQTNQLNLVTTNTWISTQSEAQMKQTVEDAFTHSREALASSKKLRKRPFLFVFHPFAFAFTITESERSLLADKILTDNIKKNQAISITTNSTTVYRSGIRTAVTSVINNTIIIDPFQKRWDTARVKINFVWDQLEQYTLAAHDEYQAAIAEAAGIARDEVTAVPAGSDEEQVARVNVLPAFSRLADPDPDAEITGHYLAATNAVAHANLSAAEKARLIGLAERIYALRLRAREKNRLARALCNNTPQILNDAGNTDTPARLEYEKIIEAIRSQALADTKASPNPLARVKDIQVNANSRALAFSDNSDQQIELANVGYLWRDTYRPMTFQAVLNSLMYTHDNSYSTRTIKVMQSLATVAGGMAGFGPVVSEFNSVGYLQGVNFFSTIFVPETSKLILDDLNKYIRNLGEMGMDTVVVVPPNDVVDRYIFFPKGPIYNFVDEFNVTDPAYIKDIDNDDVNVEATLIDQGVTVLGGGIDSADLVSRALNEGQLDATAELLKQSDLREHLRRLELAAVVSKINALFENLPAPDAGTAKSAKRMEAEKQACSLAKNFKTQFGEDASGSLDSLLAQYNVNCDSAPPTVRLSDIPSVDLLPGVPSQSFKLPVSDTMGDWTLSITNTPSNPDFVSPTNVQVKLPAVNGKESVSFTVLATPTAAPVENADLVITFSITNTLNLVTNLPVPATIHTPQFTFQSIPGLAGFKQSGNTLSLPGADKVVFVEVMLPVYDSDLSSSALANWSFSPADKFQTNGWNISADSQGLQKRLLPDSKAALAVSLIIDPSLVTNQTPLQLPITIQYGGQVITRTNLAVTIHTGP